MAAKTNSDHSVTLDKLKSRFSDAVLKSDTFRNELTVTVRKERIAEILQFLKEDSELSYDYLVDVTAVDCLRMEASPRFAVVYHLRSMKYGRRVRIKAPVSEQDARIESVCALWKSANWLERETHEMYGIVFDRHPDLRRLLTPETFKDYPLRKDYPLQGKGEREALLPEGS